MCLLTKVEDTINKYKLLNNGDRVLIGVSGGPDSLALLHVLKSLKDKYDLYLHIAHLDHMIRGKESAEDARFVEKIAREWEIPITTKAYDVKSYQQEEGLSPEDAARQVRYEFFFELTEKFNINKIAVGHHANDQAETVVMKFLRGAGLKGLGGIYPRQGKVIRPFIDLTREEIENYCFSHQLNPRIDKSNFEDIYLRNKVRLDLIPSLEKDYNNNLIATLNRTADLLREEENFLTRYTTKKLEEITLSKVDDKLILDKEELLDLDLAIQRRIIRESYNFLQKDYKDLYYNHVELVLELIKNSETGSQLDLPQDISVRLNYNEIIFAVKAENDIDYFNYKLSIGVKKLHKLGLQINSKVCDKNYSWQETLSNPSIACFDLDKIGKEFYLRQRKDGDRFYPLGMKGSKKLKDFLIDNKISLDKRDQIPIFTTLEGDIFWVGGLRVDNRFKITNETEKILMIETQILKEEL
ncbi:tRNA lysidine(34) synthetase TilS [Orenia marismortui]|uniref:tRNA(Ile)-lysidine synthase n=1 Tax=Orenia marismortui TaxID=46469 RepID=A0A4V6QBG2_9FIRM|nr:tRNA lysidine(34) synthetase TilS [Orenia marismortui]TDX59119.1 tRNA(Ile)-lysidine synthase [Orenia marismortui]